jgi:Glycoside hydrolase family 44
VGGGGGAGGSPADGGGSPTPGDPGAADVQMEIRSDQNVHAISPLIYGTNGPQNPTQNRYTLLRSGGNRMTAYNWENNASNAGSDYMFQNDGLLSTSNTPGDALKGVLDGARAIGASALLTIPIVDYVAADKNGGGDVRNSGSNYLQTRFRQNRAVKGSALSTTPDATDAFVNEDEFVNWVKAVGAPAGPPVLFDLDNEPDLWSSTHAEVHPAPAGYDELCTRNITYATMVKNVWPAAQVSGFVSYGWDGYLSLQNAPDASGKGEFIDYYLGKMKAAGAAAGKRLVDYLDLHWYPEAQGGGVRIVGADTTAAVVAARVQAPRSLWDTTYSETSWIVDTLGQPIRLIPRMRDKIAAGYPGTLLAVSEWNYGGGQHISGAVAAADVLGVFGREGVALASYWPLNGNESFANAAFRAYRNFDGAGSAFGDTSIYASTSDVATATVYASVDAASSSRVVVVAINKSTASKTAGIKIAHPSTFGRLKVYTLTSAGAQLAAGTDVKAAAANAFRYTMPAMSVSVLVPAP